MTRTTGRKNTASTNTGLRHPERSLALSKKSTGRARDLAWSVTAVKLTAAPLPQAEVKE